MNRNELKVLRSAAYMSGDEALELLANIALGGEKPVPSAEEWEDRYGAGGYADDVRAVVIEHGSLVESALALCKSARYTT